MKRDIFSDITGVVIFSGSSEAKDTSPKLPKISSIEFFSCLSPRGASGRVTISYVQQWANQRRRGNLKTTQRPRITAEGYLNATVSIAPCNEQKPQDQYGMI